MPVNPERNANGDLVASLSGAEFALPKELTHAAGRQCVLGLRPEALQFVDPDTANAIPVTIEAETPLNEKVVTLVITSEQHEILVSRPADSPGPRSGQTHIAAFSNSSAWLFAPDSGARIHPSTVQEADL